MERADEVLALGEVDPGLAADRGVDLGDERRGDVHDRHAAEIRRRQEPRRVAERASADRHEGSPRPTRRVGQLARRVADDRQALRVLALREQDRLGHPSARPRSAARLRRRPPTPRLRDEEWLAAPRRRSVASTSSAAVPVTDDRSRPIGMSPASRLELAARSMVVAPRAAHRRASTTAWTCATPVLRIVAAA